MLRCIVLLSLFINSVQGNNNKYLALFDKQASLIPKNDEADLNKYTCVIKCIVSIIELELQFRPTVTILERPGNVEEDKFNNLLINNLMEHNIPQVILQDVDSANNHRWYNYSLTIVFFSSFDAVIDFNITRFRKEIKLLVIISDPSINDWDEKLKEIGHPLGKYDVIFIVKDFVEDKNEIYSIFPYIVQHNCEGKIGVPVHINTCHKNTMVKKGVTVKHKVNLNKCPFKVGFANLFPFSTVKDKDLLTNYDRIEDVHGSDFEIMKIVTEYFNATLDLYYIFRREENPYRDLEFLGLIRNESLDAGAGGLYRIYGPEYEYSGIYASQDVIWIYRAERPEQSWENLLRKMSGLYFFVLFYFIYTIVWYLICQFDGEAVSLVKTFIYSWGALVGATSLQDPRSMKQKILNLMYLIMCIFLSAYMSMQLYSFLTIRGPPHVFKTNDEVMASGRPPILDPNAKYFNTDPNYVRFANTSKDCFTFVHCAEETLKQNGLTIYLQGNFYIFQANTAVNDEAQVLRATENILTVYYEMIIRKNSPLVFKFQKVIQRLFESGITGRLFREAVGIFTVAKANTASANMMADSHSCKAGCAITFKQIAGMFYAWISGCVLSSIVFAVELYKNRDRALMV